MSTKKETLEECYELEFESVECIFFCRMKASELELRKEEMLERTGSDFGSD